MRSNLLRAGLATLCLAGFSFGSSVTYTELASVVGGCQNSVGTAIDLNGHGTCTVDTVNSTLTTAGQLGTFNTDGAHMVGLSVTATFSDSFSETLLWAATGATSGGVSDATPGSTHQWSLTQSGDTFTNPWTISNSATASITSIVIQGLGASNANCLAGTDPTVLCGTVFDRLSPGGDTDTNEQTPDSHRGTDWTISAQSSKKANYTIDLAYSNEFQITSTNVCNITGSTVTERDFGPCADEWAKMTIQFTGTSLGKNDTLSFIQDSDTTVSAPEPASLSLFGAGLLAIAGLIRKRNSLGQIMARCRRLQ